MFGVRFSNSFDIIFVQNFTSMVGNILDIRNINIGWKSSGLCFGYIGWYRFIFVGIWILGPAILGPAILGPLFLVRVSATLNCSRDKESGLDRAVALWTNELWQRSSKQNNAV